MSRNVFDQHGVQPAEEPEEEVDGIDMSIETIDARIRETALKLENLKRLRDHLKRKKNTS